MLSGILKSSVLQYVLWGYLLIINLVTFVNYGLDKRYARKDRWRIPEKRLLLLAAAGGSAGAVLGMYLFHHKTRKWKFRILVPFFLAVHILLLIFLYWRIFS